MSRIDQIMVMGDVHGEFGKLNSLVNKKKPEIILQCGDFGYWPRYVSKRDKKRRVPLVPRIHDAKLYFCDGNHEDFLALRERADDELYPNVFYMPRGSTLILPDGRVVLFMGGADSHDKAWRLAHEHSGGDKIWFPEERITEEDLRALPNRKVDIILSHAVPNEFVVSGDGQDGVASGPSRTALSVVLHKYKDSKPLWFFGHYHSRIVGTYEGVKYFGLNMAGSPYWWMMLPHS